MKITPVVLGLALTVLPACGGAWAGPLKQAESEMRRKLVKKDAPARTMDSPMEVTLAHCSGQMEGIDTTVELYGSLAAVIEGSLRKGTVVISVQPQPAPTSPVGFLFHNVSIQAAPESDPTFWLKARWRSHESAPPLSLQDVMDFTLDLRESADGKFSGTLTKKGGGVDISASLACSPIPR